MSIDAGGKVISTDPGDMEDVKEESNHFCDINNFQEIIFNLIHLCIEQFKFELLL